MSFVALELIRGNTGTYTVTITDGATPPAPVDITGAVLTFEARVNPTDTTPALTSTLTVNPDQTGHKGQATLSLAASATAALSAPQVMTYAITMVLSGTTSTPIEGSFLLSLDAGVMAPMACTLAQVKQVLYADQPTMSDQYDATLTDAIIDITDLITQEIRQQRGEAEGWTFLPGSPVTRRYTGVAGGSDLVLIDDAVSVSAVSLLTPQGALAQTLVAGTDYLLYPQNSLPTVGLTRLLGAWWPWYAGAISVTLTPGYATSWPGNIQRAAMNEVIRAWKAGQAGVTDTLGVSPDGTVILSKALLDSTVRMCRRYRFGAATLRRAS